MGPLSLVPPGKPLLTCRYVHILSAKLGYLKESKTIFNKELKNSGVVVFTIWIEGTPLNYRNTSLEVYIKNLPLFVRRMFVGLLDQMTLLSVCILE